MSEKINLAKKLAVNRYCVDEHSHIVTAEGFFSKMDKLEIIRICPAGLYSLDEDENLIVSHLGCLECGACRAIGIDRQIEKWEYPESGYGIIYRYG